jgi:hypothetical protein
MAKKKLTLEKWFANLGSFEPRRDLDMIRAGVKAGYLNEQDEYGLTALYLAAVNGWVEGVEELLRAGADTELRYHRTGETALLSVMCDLGTANGERLNSAAVVAALIAGGANPDAGNHFGQTPRKLAEFRGLALFDNIRAKRVQMPEPRIQNAEHLADHHWPRFEIPEREEREALKVGTAVDLYVYGPRGRGKQDTMKVRITKRTGRRPNVRYAAKVETPLKQTHLPRGTKEVEFGPEHVATVYVARTNRKNA